MTKACSRATRVVNDRDRFSTALGYVGCLCEVPNASFLKSASIVGLVIGELALVVAVSVGRHWLPLTVGAFIATAFYQTVVTIFPYAVVGIMGKEIQETAHGFNNNGLYIGVLMLFSAASELTVQIYGAEKISPLGTGNVMALSCVLFAAGITCTAAFSVASSSPLPQRRRS